MLCKNALDEAISVRASSRKWLWEGGLDIRGKSSSSIMASYVITHKNISPQIGMQDRVTGCYPYEISAKTESTYQKDAGKTGQGAVLNTTA